MKKYSLLIDSPEYPKGTKAIFNEEDGTYDLHTIDSTDPLENEKGFIACLAPWQVENRPTVWERLLHTECQEGRNCTESAEEREEITEEQDKEEWPKEDQECFILSDYGSIDQYFYHKAYHGQMLLEAASLFPTREAAATELLLRKLMVKRYRPQRNDRYYRWDFYLESAELDYWLQDRQNFENFLLGNTFPYTDEGKKLCEEYGKQLQKCIDFYLSQTNKE